jgi:hypothetical protein
MIWKICVCIAAIAALAMPSTAMAGRTLDVDPNRVEFGPQPWNSFTKRTVRIQNVSNEPVAVAVEPGFVPDDFSPGQPESTCPLTSPTTLAPGESCVHVIGYYADPADPFRGRRQIDLQVVARSLGGTTLERQTVRVTARGTSVVLDAPDGVTFGRQAFETFETRTFTVSNTTEHTITLRSSPGLPDDFSHLIDSTCGLGDKVLAPHESCTHVIGFRPTPFFAGLETATVLLEAFGPSGLLWEERTVVITGRGV